MPPYATPRRIRKGLRVGLRHRALNRHVQGGVPTTSTVDMRPNSKPSTIERLAVPGAASVIAPLQGSPQVQEGRVVVLSLEALRERIGARWTLKRDEVWAIVSARQDAHLTDDDLCARIGDTELLIAVKQGDASRAQALGLKILEDVTTHFLGAAEPVDLRLGTVAGIDGPLVTSVDLDPSAIEAPWRPAESPLNLSDVRRRVAFGEERQRNPVWQPTAGGERLRTQFALEPIISLKHDKIAALRVQPTISYAGSGRLVGARQLGDLTDDEIGFIDRAALDFAALFLSRRRDDQPPLIVPASFRTLGGRKGRRDLVSLPDITMEQTKKGLFIELVEIDPGTPAGRLAEVSGLVGAVCRGVFVRLQTVKHATAPVRELRLQGFTLDTSEASSTDTDVAHHLLAIAADARPLAPVLIAHGLPSRDFFAVAELAGFTHAAWRAVGVIDQKPPIAASAAA